MPSNAGYYVAAYIATAVILLAYGLTIVRRARALRANAPRARDEQPPTGQERA